MVRARILITLAVVAGCGALAPRAEAAAEPIALGAYVPGDLPAAIDDYSRLVQAEPGIVSSYRYWTDPAIVPRDLDAVANRGAVPLVTWEPWGGPDGFEFPLNAITAGEFDPYIRESARDAAAWGKPLLLRFAHEMNGDWYPWGVGVGGNTPRIYVAAWRHVVRVFREEGADNVRWVWAPNVDDDGSQPFEDLFPGEAWVDLVGLDGFNWGGAYGWRSFTEIFGPSYKALGRLTGKPVIIAETGSAEDPGDKRAWILSMFGEELPKFQRIRAVVWFNRPHGDRADWRVQSSPAALAAFRSVAGRNRYRGAGDALVGSDEEADDSGALTPPTEGFGAPSWADRLLERLEGRELWAAAGGTALVLALGLSAWMLRRRSRSHRG